MIRFYTLTAAMIFTGSMAAAAVTADSLVQDLQARGFNHIEIKTGLTQIKAEATNGTNTFEAIYDIATGQILKSETGTVGVFDDTTPGVELSDRNRDFVRIASADGDGSHDGGDDAGGDNGGDDNNGGDNGGDHGDDNGGDHGGDNGGDNGGDHGSDSSGSDD